jgi:hypothetical protein
MYKASVVSNIQQIAFRRVRRNAVAPAATDDLFLADFVSPLSGRDIWSGIAGAPP